jgi:hypothetical protein
VIFSGDDSERGFLLWGLLDTLSCGVGAALVLFIVISVMGAPGPPVVQYTSGYIAVRWEIEDPDALMRIFVQTPQDTMVEVTADTSIMEGTYVSGLDPAAIRSADAGETQEVLLFLKDPDPGRWIIRIRYVSRRGGSGWQSIAATQPASGRLLLQQPAWTDTIPFGLEFGRWCDVDVQVTATGDARPSPMDCG